MRDTRHLCIRLLSRRTMLPVKNTTLIIVLLLAAAASAVGQHSSHKIAKKQHWEETDSETLWRGRYANCDYGFYVLLPDGIVGHGTHSPSPNHGFLVALPEVGTAEPVSNERQRFIWLNAEYDASDSGTRKGSIDQYVGMVGLDMPGRKVISQRIARLGTLYATRITVEYRSSGAIVVEEKVVALRHNIIYEIGLRTTKQDYAADRAQLDRLVAGFRVWKIHYC
jgi:hypothetical protein